MAVIVDALPGCARIGRAEDGKKVIDLARQIQRWRMAPGGCFAEAKIERLLYGADIGEAGAEVCGMEQSTSGSEPKVAFCAGGRIEVSAGKTGGGSGGEGDASVGAQEDGAAASVERVELERID